MTIDPSAAVTAAAGGAGTSAAGAGPALSSSAPPSPQDGSQVRVADQGGKVDLFDYATQAQNKPPAIETLHPESKAKYLSNPQALGDQVLQRLEGLHERSLNYRDVMNSTSTAAPTAGGDVMAGPASGNVAGSTDGGQNGSFSYLTLMFDYALETTMISSSSTQFVSGVNTLMKGQ